MYIIVIEFVLAWMSWEARLSNEEYRLKMFGV